MSDRRVDGFFYRLFMDVALLEASGVMAENPRKAYVDGYSLRIGQRAPLGPAERGRACSRVLALTHDELDALYRAPGLEDYRPEAVQANRPAGGSLLQPPRGPGGRRAQRHLCSEAARGVGTPGIPSGPCRFGVSSERGLIRPRREPREVLIHLGASIAGAPTRV